jgi:hypothetical protein
MTTLVVGREEAAHQFADIAYSGDRRLQRVGKFFLWQINPSNLPEADVTVISTSQHLRRFLNSGYTLLPWLNFILPLHRPMASLKNRFSRRRRRDAKKIQRRAYSYRVSRGDAEDFDYFYHRIYCPYVAWRFGKAAFVEKYSDLRARYVAQGGILWVNYGDQPVAGLAFQVHGETVNALALGANMKYVRSERSLAGEASLLSLIEWGKRNGCKWLNYGTTPPFLRNGLFQYKKEWGMIVEAKNDQAFCALKIGKVNESSLSFLQQNPFATLEEGRVAGVVVLGHEHSTKELKKLVLRHRTPGVESLALISFFRRPSEKQNTPSSTPKPRSAKGLPSFVSTVSLSLKHKGFNIEVIKQHCTQHKASATRPIRSPNTDLHGGKSSKDGAQFAGNPTFDTT